MNARPLQRLLRLVPFHWDTFCSPLIHSMSAAGTRPRPTDEIINGIGFDGPCDLPLHCPFLTPSSSYLLLSDPLRVPLIVPTSSPFPTRHKLQRRYARVTIINGEVCFGTVRTDAGIFRFSLSLVIDRSFGLAGRLSRHSLFLGHEATMTQLGPSINTRQGNITPF
ncbi:hypothetical protein AFLA_009627 [Aspergillus flavus NRRL3357]|nr:hypothetical protein AFLA_009627 [Aspergillus flavus NRRL3357]